MLQFNNVLSNILNIKFAVWIEVYVISKGYEKY